MKKLMLMALVFALLLPVCALADGVVNVFNWEDYIDESVLEMFEEETGIHVNYMNFTTTPLVQNLSTLIYSAARRGIEPSLNALSALMFVALLVLLLVVNRRTAENN